MLKKTLIILLLIFGMIYPTTSYAAKTTTKTSTTKTTKKKKKKIVGYKIKYKTEKYEDVEKEYLGEFWITHYCPCARCCGKWGGKVTASGTTPTAGRTVGVNTKLIPYGTKLQVGNVDTYVAEDTGGGIEWKHLDIFCATHQEALNAGVGYYPVYKLTTVTKKRRVKIKIPIYGTVLKAKKGWIVNETTGSTGQD